MTDEMLESLMARVKDLEARMDIFSHRMDMFFEIQIDINKYTLNQLENLVKALKKDEA